MEKEAERGFTASQFAKLHNISRSTLLYYDEIGLFAPEGKRENGYRYYTYRQSQALEMILTFRELDMSIEEIKEYMKNPSQEALLAIFDDKLKEVEQSMRRLREMKRLLKRRKETLLQVQDLETGMIEQVHCGEEYLLVSPARIQWSLENEILSVTEHARKYHKYRRYNHSFGTLLSEEALKNERFEECDGYYTKVDRPLKKGEVFVKPAGTYLKAISVGGWDRLMETYRNIMEYAKENGIEFTGYSYEEGLNELVARGEEEYVTQIMIRVKERKKTNEETGSV